MQYKVFLIVNLDSTCFLTAFFFLGLIGDGCPGAGAMKLDDWSMKESLA